MWLLGFGLKPTFKEDRFVVEILAAKVCCFFVEYTPAVAGNEWMMISLKVD